MDPVSLKYPQDNERFGFLNYKWVSTKSLREIQSPSEKIK